MTVPHQRKWTNSPESIADKFKDIYEKLYNRTSNSEPINKLLSEINENVCEKDMDDVEKVTSEMVENILKTKIKTIPVVMIIPE